MKKRDGNYLFLRLNQSYQIYQPFRFENKPYLVYLGYSNHGRFDCSILTSSYSIRDSNHMRLPVYDFNFQGVRRGYDIVLLKEMLKSVKIELNYFKVEQ